MKTFFGHIRFLLLTLILGAGMIVSCGKLQSPQTGRGDGGQKSDATLTLTISSAPETKAEGDKSAKDGDKMLNLRVWMVDSSNKVSEFASSANTGEVTFSSDATTATVTFSDVVRGDYTLYLLANNTSELTSYGLNSTIDVSFTKAALSLPSGSTYPSYSVTEGMPLSLKKSISVGPGVNKISAEIVRVCGQINVTINNRTTDRPIYITGVSLSKRSPSSGYVFQQDDHSSPDGTTQGDLASITTLTRINPGEGNTMLSCYLFENCSGTDALELTVTGGLYDSSVASVERKSGYEATGSATNTGINPSKYYFIASAVAQRHFLKADASGNLIQEEVGSDSELFVKDDVTNYLWQFSSTESPTKVKNVATGKYINISITRSGSFLNYTYTASYSLGSEQEIQTSTSTGRQFYGFYDGTLSDRYSYLYYDTSGNFGVTTPSTSTSSDTSTGWYLREATAFTTLVLDPSPEKTLNHTSKLSYTDSYGEVQPLTKICRNDKVEIIVNLFYNPLTSSFDFQVEPWRVKTNETTFD